MAEPIQLPGGGIDLLLEISRGTVSNTSHINKFGTNPSVANNTTEDVWDGGGTYSFPSTADITHIVQAVDQAAMRGKNIEVQGLDVNWAQVTQTKALDASNTTTAVALDTALIRVFRMRILANVVGDQDIHARNSGGGTTYATIQAGNNQTLMAIYSVPAGKTGYILRYYADGVQTQAQNPDSINCKLWVADRDNNYEFQLKHSKAIPNTGGSIGHSFTPYLKIDQKSDIKITALPSGKASEVNAGFDLILVDN